MEGAAITLLLEQSYSNGSTTKRSTRMSHRWSRTSFYNTVSYLPVKVWQHNRQLPSHFWAHTQPRPSLLCPSFCSSIPDIYPIQPNPISERRRYPWGLGWELRQDLCETCKAESADFGGSQTVVGTAEEENERRQRWIDTRVPWVVEKSSQEFLQIFTQFITIFGGRILCQPKSCEIFRSDTVATQDLCKKGKFLSTHKPPMSWDSVSDLSRDNRGSSNHSRRQNLFRWRFPNK